MDVGANVGTTTIPAVKEYAAVHEAIAFEIEHENCKLLKINAIFNDVEEKVIVENMGLSDTCSKRKILFSKENMGDHRVSELKDFVDDATAIDLVTIDDYIAQKVIEYDSIKYLWIITQGHENFVLQGAKMFLTKTHTPVKCAYFKNRLIKNGTLESFEENVMNLFTHFIVIMEYKNRKLKKTEMVMQEIGKIRELRTEYNNDEYCELVLLKV